VGVDIYRAGIRVAAIPPSTCKVMPWIFDASSEARNNTALATSCGSMGTPAGVLAVMASRMGREFSLPGVSVAPGATVFTRTPCGPNSAAQRFGFCREGSELFVAAAEVRSEERRGSAGVNDFFHDGFSAGGVASTDNDHGAVGGEGGDDGFTDAAGRAGDDGGVSCEALSLCCHDLWSTRAGRGSTRCC
jgi:hypothetical protein